MISARHTLLGIHFFRWYTKNRLNRHFERIELKGNFQDEGMPILLLANHFTWWDGFIQGLLNIQVLQRKYHVLMLEEQLRKYPILRSTGAFSIRKKSHDMFKSLAYCQNILQEKKNLLVLFPQGELQSMHMPELKFERGVSRIIQSSYPNIQVMMNVNLVDYHARKRPTLNVYYKELILDERPTHQELSQLFNSYYQECQSIQCQ